MTPPTTEVGHVNAPEPRRPSPLHSQEEVDAALAALALCSGNAERASRELAATGLVIQARTLRRWLTTQHRERYHEIREQLVPRIHARIAAVHEDLAQQAGVVEQQVLSSLLEKVWNDELSASDLHQAVRNLAVSTGVHSDKAALMRNKPTVIVEHRSAADIARELAELRPDVLVFEGEAELVETETDGAGGK